MAFVDSGEVEVYFCEVPIRILLRIQKYLLKQVNKCGKKLRILAVFLRNLHENIPDFMEFLARRIHPKGLLRDCLCGMKGEVQTKRINQFDRRCK